MSDPARAAAAAQALEALRQRYRASIGKTIEAFRALATSLAAQPDAAEVVETLRRELHRVRGTAGSYGFSEASRLCGVMEDRAVRWSADPRLEARERSAIVQRFIAALATAFDEGTVPVDLAPSPSARRLLGVDLAPAFGAALTEEGRMRGFEVIAQAEGSWTPATLRESAPHVIVTVAGSAEAVHRAMGKTNVPLVILGDGSDVALMRRVAQIAQAQVLYAADDPGAVFDMVTRAAGRTSWAGARVLVCDDDADVLALVRTIVEETGMQVVTLAHPERLLEELDRVRPSLLLLDINLGNADGIALTRAVRGVEAYATMPLILFSTETDARTREAALAAGADEFLPKPIVSGELRARVIARLDAERLRRLDEGRHPGTGLLLAERTRAAVTETVARQRARQSACTVAWLRPAGPAMSGPAERAWHAEARRVADLLSEGHVVRLVGYANDHALAVVAEEGADALGRALAAAAGSRPTDATPWHAGVAALSPALDAGDALLSAASDAAGVAELALAPVHAWSAGDARLAPDVVVIEDDSALADMLRYALDTQGYTYRVYGTGTEAIEALLAMRPRAGRRPLVLLDVELPGLDGHSLHERLRVERPGVFAVVFATVHGSEGEQLRALRAGALDYIVKPVSLRVLMAKIPNWMAAAGEPRS